MPRRFTGATGRAAVDYEEWLRRVRLTGITSGQGALQGIVAAEGCIAVPRRITKDQLWMSAEACCRGWQQGAMGGGAYKAGEVETRFEGKRTS